MANSVKNFDTINMQTRATLLAKEGIDLAFHHRDSNLDKVILGTTTHELKINIKSEEMKNFFEQAEIPPSKSDFQSIKIKIPITC